MPTERRISDTATSILNSLSCPTLTASFSFLYMAPLSPERQLGCHAIFTQVLRHMLYAVAVCNADSAVNHEQQSYCILKGVMKRKKRQMYIVGTSE